MSINIHDQGRPPTPAGPVKVHLCTWAEVRSLERVFPSGSNQLHASRYREQQAGLCSYLVASSGVRIVGHAKVRWDGSVHDGVRTTLGGIPELRRLLVSESARGAGVGTALIEAAEQLAIVRGCRSLGLAVRVDNLDAKRLYRRMGFVDWGAGSFESRWTLLDEAGRPVEYSQEVDYMHKALRAPAGVRTVA